MMNRLAQRTVLAGIALATASGLMLATPATAAPAGGAGANTPGASSTVSPKSLTAGSTIKFTIRGFPASEVVYIKIDDGNTCSKSSTQGACVVHQQMLDSKGSASGSFVIPGDIQPGAHWLRFLSSEEMKDASGKFVGVKGYTTRQGSNFTVVAGGSGGGQTTGGSTTTTGGGTVTAPIGPAANVVAAGQTLELTAPPAAAGSASTAATTPEEASATTVEGEEPLAEGPMSAGTREEIESSVDAVLAAQAAEDAAAAQPAAADDNHTPWVGIAGLAIFAALAGALIAGAFRRG